MTAITTSGDPMSDDPSGIENLDRGLRGEREKSVATSANLQPGRAEAASNAHPMHSNSQPSSFATIRLVGLFSGRLATYWLLFRRPRSSATFSQRFASFGTAETGGRQEEGRERSGRYAFSTKIKALMGGLYLLRCLALVLERYAAFHKPTPLPNRLSRCFAS